MTVTLNPRDRARTTDDDGKPGIDDTAQAKTDAQELALLLAQAYVATPLLA